MFETVRGLASGLEFCLEPTKLSLNELNRTSPAHSSRLKKEGSLHVIDLCNGLEVSSVTIRKDLKMLEDRQLLFRTTADKYLTALLNC